MTELHDLIRELVSISAARVHKQYADFASRDDIEQEIWVWSLGTTHHRDGTSTTREELLRSWLETEGLDDGIDYRLGCWRAGKAFDRVGQRWSRREKAIQEGYEPADEYFYTRGLVAEMLPLAFGLEAQATERVQSSNGKDPAEGGDLAAMVEDVRTALECIPMPKRHLLTDRFRDQRDVAELAVEHGCGVSTLYERLNKALDAIVEELGGRSPYDGPV